MSHPQKRQQKQQQQRNRKYDLVVFGATGYTGKLTSEQVLLGTPSTLKWAIAGRSPLKLELLAHEYNRLYPDRVPVAEIYIADLSEFSVERLASCTRLLISTVGPFIKYGTPVLEACAVYGTHYVDCTGEYPWVYEMIKRCHKTAQGKRSIIIPQAGFESAPVDWGTFALVKAVRDELGVGVTDVTFSMHKLKGQLSGGTFETAMTVFEHATLQELHEASQFDALSPVKGPEQPFRYPIRKDEDLGILTSWINNTGDRSVVFRSWGLLDDGKYYGQQFTWKEYMRVSSYVTAFIWMVLLKIAILIPLIIPLKWIVRKLFHPGQGEGPSEEARRTHSVEWRGVAIADEDSDTPRKAFVRVHSTIDPYTLTAVCLVQVANSILFGENTVAAQIGGGILTPACVASPELFRLLDRAGLKIETKII